MSRPYRIRVSQSLRRVVRAEDSVKSVLELLPILEADEMADLLARQLDASGFRESGSVWVKEVAGVRVEVDPKTREVAVTVSSERELRLKKTESVSTYSPKLKKQTEAAVKRKLNVELEERAEKHEKQLAGQIADRMEAVLRDLQPELDQIINRTTAESLKVKAGRLGRIKEISQDDQDGSVTIVVEV